MDQKYLKYKNKYLELKNLIQMGGNLKVGDTVYIKNEERIDKINQIEKFEGVDRNLANSYTLKDSHDKAYFDTDLQIPKFQIGTHVIINGRGSNIKDVEFSNQKGIINDINYSKHYKEFIYDITLIEGTHPNQLLNEVLEEFLKIYEDVSSPIKHLCKRK